MTKKGRPSVYTEEIADERLVEIYGLFDPRTGAIRYIGKANDAAKRLKSHLRDCRRRATPVYNWINKLLKEGLAPSVEVLVRCSATEWQAEERRLIAEARARGPLLNVADGGDEPFCPPEVRSSNGHRLVKSLADDPEKKRIWNYKRQLASALKHGWLSNKARAMMRESAALRPDLFGSWANLPDREENEAGFPIEGVMICGHRVVLS